MVAIKGLGMPSCCANCPCSKYEEVRWMEYKFIRCGVTLSKPDKSKNIFWDRESRLKDCPLIEAIPKADYEARLKADLEAILTDLQLEIEEVPKYCMTHDSVCVYRKAEDYISDINKLIQQKINALKGGNE